MNKKELIEHISNTLDEYLKNTAFVKPVLSITEIANSGKVSLEFEINKNCILLDDISYQFGYDQGRLDGEWVGQQLKNADKIRQEINKPTIPQFVADWIEYCKENHLTITGAFEPVSEHGIGLAETFKGSAYKCTRWALDNQNLFARAWLDGYTVEKEKRYRVKVKGMNRINGYLAYNKINGAWYFGISGNSKNHSTNHTRKELEDAGFGWVFDCEGIEIEEVEG